MGSANKIFDYPTRIVSSISALSVACMCNRLNLFCYFVGWHENSLLLLHRKVTAVIF